MNTFPRLLDRFRRAPVDPIERSMRELERQGGGLVRVAHLFATLMIVLFSLGSLMALSGDAFDAIVATVRRGGVPGVPQAVSIAVSTLMVVCCDVGLVYAAMVLRALRTRGAASGYALHAVVLVSVSAIEAGTYLYMSARYEQPATWAAWALVVARAAAAPLLSVYLSMAAKLPITSRDILHQAELWQGIQLVRDVIAVAADPAAPLADKMGLYEKSAVMTEADRRRLGEMIAVVKRRQSAGQSAVAAGGSADPDRVVATGPAGVDGDHATSEQPIEGEEDGEGEVIPVPALRYSARRLMDRLEATR